MNAHLTSIRDQQDIEFIHSLIVESLRSNENPPFKTYIGKSLTTPKTRLL